MKRHKQEGGENHDARLEDIRGTRFVSWAPGQRIHLERKFAGCGALAVLGVVGLLGFFCASISCGFWGFALIGFLISLFWEVEHFSPVFMFAWIFGNGALGAVVACWLTLRGSGDRDVILDWREGHLVYRRGRKVREYRLADIAAVKLKGSSWSSRGSAYFCTCLYLTLPDGDLAILESDVFSNDSEAAHQQLLPVVLELSQSLKVPWEWKAFEVELLQIKEQEKRLEIRANPGYSQFGLGFLMLPFTVFVIWCLGLLVIEAYKRLVLEPIIFSLVGVGAAGVGAVLGGGLPLALTLYVMSGQRLVLNSSVLRYSRVFFGIPLWQRRFSLDQIRSATCVIRNHCFTLRIETGRRPIYFGNDLSFEELAKASEQLEEFLLRMNKLHPSQEMP